MFKDKEKYLDKLQANIDKGKARFSDLEAKAKNAKDEVKTLINKEMDDLQDKRKKAEEKLSELKDAGENAWDELKDGADKAWDELEGGFKKLFANKTTIEYRDFCKVQELDPDEFVEFFKEHIANEPGFQKIVLEYYQKYGKKD